MRFDRQRHGNRSPDGFASRHDDDIIGPGPGTLPVPSVLARPPRRCFDELDQFEQAVLELGLIPARELKPFVAEAVGSVKSLALALVVAGKLTRYQAAALTQGKGRGLAIGNYFILS